MAQNARPARPRRFVRGQQYAGIQFEMPRRVQCHIGRKTDIADMTRFTQQQPAPFLPLPRCRIGQNSFEKVS